MPVKSKKRKRPAHLAPDLSRVGLGAGFRLTVRGKGERTLVVVAVMLRFLSPSVAAIRWPAARVVTRDRESYRGGERE